MKRKFQCDEYNACENPTCASSLAPAVFFGFSMKCWIRIYEGGRVSHSQPKHIM